MRTEKKNFNQLFSRVTRRFSLKSRRNNHKQRVPNSFCQHTGSGNSLVENTNPLKRTTNTTDHRSKFKIFSRMIDDSESGLATIYENRNENDPKRTVGQQNNCKQKEKTSQIEPYMDIDWFFDTRI